MGINFSEDGKNLIHNQEPIVEYSGYLTVKVGGKEVGRVNATFDFRELPPEHHHTAIQLIMQGARTLCIPANTPPEAKVVEEPKKEKKWFGLF